MTTPAIQTIGLENQPISWSKEEEPHSELFDDCFYPPGEGLEISRHTFLYPNNIPTRCGNEQSLVIGEIGFGTGLNLFATLQQWRRAQRDNGLLHFVSFEKYLLTPDEIRRALNKWPELKQFVDPFCDRMPPQAQGVFRIALPEHRALVTLHIGDARAMIGKCNGIVDAWYLDGFAPSRNPELWNDTIFESIARLSHSGTTLSTFSAAGHVRRSLQSHGFHVQKIPGYGTKRDSIRANFQGQTTASPPQSPKRIAIMGGGIAAASLAHSLCLRGAEVTIFEQHDQLASGGSGNAQAIILPYLSTYGGTLHQLYLGGFQYSQGLYQSLAQSTPDFQFHQSGVIQSVFDKRTKTLEEHLEALNAPPELVQHLSAEQVSDLAGISIAESALHYPKAGFFSPRQAIAKLIEACNTKIELQTSHRIVQIVSQHEGIEIHTNTSNSPCQFDAIIVAGAHESRHIPSLHWLPIEPLKGQVLTVPVSSSSSKLRTPLCGKSYLIPATEIGEHIIGSTFEREVTHLEENTTLGKELLESASTWSSEFSFSARERNGFRCSFRASTPDRTPLVGECPTSTSGSYSEVQALCRNGEINESSFSSSPSLLISAGFGSRGMISAPLAAEILCSTLYGEPAPCSTSLLDGLSPKRFIQRAIKKSGR